VQDGVLELGFDTARLWRLAVRHHHADLAAEMLFIEAERVAALACEVHIGIHFHHGLLLQCAQTQESDL
jgi:hypothetical protein